MVMTVMLAQGISEKGGEKQLHSNQLLGQMLRKVAEGCRGFPLVLLYCADGKDVMNSWEMVEIKCTIRLIQSLCHDIQITSRSFSFYDPDAVQKLDEGHVFYFKGFGGGVDRMQSIFGEEQDVTPRTRDLVKHFQNRIMFSSPERCSLLTFMVCGAAILMGTHYPGQRRIVALNLLGDVHVKYHACETTKNIQLTEEVNVIQLAPGVANIMWFEQGRLDISVHVVARNRCTNYATFAALSEGHIRTVMLSNALKWKMYQWEDKFWACRADGYITVAPTTRHCYSALLLHIKEIEGLVFLHDQSLDQFWFLFGPA